MATGRRSFLKDFLHLIYPEICMGCGSDEVAAGQLLCAECFHSLPATNFFSSDDNVIARKFYGRVKIAHAGSAFFYTKDSLMQRMLKALKYNNDEACGMYLGNLLANEVQNAAWIGGIDMLVPLPLSKERKFQRGYNQSALLCVPLSEKFGIPVNENVVERTVNTESQTHKTREERWNSMQNIFKVTDAETLHNKHILIVDDVLTTGATLEVLCDVVLKIPTVKVSIATLACTF